NALSVLPLDRILGSRPADPRQRLKFLLARRVHVDKAVGVPRASRLRLLILDNAALLIFDRRPPDDPRVPRQPSPAAVANDLDRAINVLPEQRDAPAIK